MFGMKLLTLQAVVVGISTFSVHAPSKTAVQDAADQSTKMLRCWEAVNVKDPHTEYVLSEPLYELCSYMPVPSGWDRFYVNGVSEDSDDYSNIMAMYAVGDQTHQVLNICLQEGFQFHAPPHASQVSLRCLCKRDGCNLPKPFEKFLDYNKLPLPEVSF